MKEVITSKEELDSVLSQWRADGYGTESMLGTPWYNGYAVEKHGLDEARGLICYPYSKDRHSQAYYFVMGVRYTRQYPGDIGRLLDDGTGKCERKSVRISSGLAAEIGVAK